MTELDLQRKPLTDFNCGNCGDIKLTEINTPFHFYGEIDNVLFLANGNSNLIFSKWYDSEQIRHISTFICSIQFPDNNLAFRCAAFANVHTIIQGWSYESEKKLHNNMWTFWNSFRAACNGQKVASSGHFDCLQTIHKKINSPLDIYWIRIQCITPTYKVHLKTRNQRWVCELFLYSFAGGILFILWFSFQTCFS